MEDFVSSGASSSSADTGSASTGASDTGGGSVSSPASGSQGSGFAIESYDTDAIPADLSVADEIDAALSEVPANTGEPISDIELEDLPSAEQDAEVADQNKQELAPADTAVKDGKADEALPEGVRVRRLDGKPVWAVDPTVGKATFERAKLVEAAEAITGEPLTEQWLEFGHNSIKNFESMRSDFLSNDPADQTKFVEGIENAIKGAMQNGEISHDALTGITTLTIDRALADDSPTQDKVLAHLVSNPKVQGRIANSLYEAALNMTPEMKRVGHMSFEDERLALWKVAGWLDTLNGRPLRPQEEMSYLIKSGARTLPSFERKSIPQTAPKEAASAAAEANPAAAAAKESFKAWVTETTPQVTAKAINEPINALVSKEVSEQVTKAYPNHVNHLRTQIASALRDRLAKDKNLGEQRTAIERRVRMTTNVQLKKDLQAEMVKRHVSRAEQLLREIKGPILSEFSSLVKSKSDQNAARAGQAQRAGTNRAPSGGPSVARQDRAKPSSRFLTASEIASEMDAAWAGR